MQVCAATEFGLAEAFVDEIQAIKDGLACLADVGRKGSQILGNSSGGREGQTKKPLRIFMLDLDLC